MVVANAPLLKFLKSKALLIIGLLLGGVGQFPSDVGTTFYDADFSHYCG